MITVEAKVVAALTGNAELMALLAKGKESVYHNQSKDAGTYPVITYTVTGDGPHQHYDNHCSAHMAIVRIWIETANGACSDIRKLVYDIMTAAGFMWQQDDGGKEDEYFYKAMDFTIAEEV